MIDQNTRFLVYLKRLEEDPAGVRLIHIHVSELPAHKKSRDNLSRAISTFTELKAKHQDGEVFLLKNLDIVFVCRTISKPILAAAGETLRKIFVGQMSVTFKNVHGGKGEFYTLFDLSYELPKIMAWAETVAGVAEVSGGGGNVGAGEPPASKGAVDLVDLRRIKEEMQRVNMASVLFNQPVYNINDSGKAKLMWQEMYISVQMLEKTFCPGLSLTSRRWLFNDLTEDLDGIVFRLLANPEERGQKKRLSINVNLSSLASSKFVTFDAELPIDFRQSVVLEINKTDLFENMRLFCELVPFLQRRGYKILLDGLSLQNVGALDFDGIRCDFAKIFWSADLAVMDPDQSARIRAKLNHRQSPLLVMGRCDTAESLRFAKEMGIVLVQGRLVDHMVKRSIPF
ncbi:MAG TPA: EAL domain-containing protein [Rhodospirillaceae bacterium]|nr:EAL domain-containing protein [Rhodospirillaceae bacterium]